MSLLSARGRARWHQALVLGCSLLACACSSDSNTPGDAGTGGTDGPSFEGMSLDQGMQLLSNTWMAQAAANPDGVTSLLDAPGGEGWLHLFHGDLVAAERSFSAGHGSGSEATSGSSRLGLARVHLEHAAMLRAVDSLHRTSALALARYRRDHAGDVRAGPYQGLLGALAAHQAGAPVEEVDQFLEATSPEVTGDDAQGAVEQIAAGLRELLAARRAGQPASESATSKLPELFQGRLRVAELVGRGDLDTASRLRTQLGPWSPDIVDPLGSDDDARLKFESHYYDADLLVAIKRLHLAEAWRLAAGIEGPGALIRTAVMAAWGDTIPDAVLGASLPTTSPQPEWQGLFLSPALDPMDWEDYWTGGRQGNSFLSRLAERTPEVPWLAGQDNASVDRVLKSAQDLEPFVKEALVQGVGSEGASMVQDLGFTHLFMDRILRTRMRSLHAEGAGVPAFRIGERTLDPNPGRLGGPEDAARTRVSFRNDRAYLVDMAHSLWRAGQTGSALDFLHPLTSQQQALTGSVYILGQLDAASSVGKGGKASQL
ncbi:MAG TPA: hypothetical protein DIU15_11990 [Deltaproteobacteria bacterium]|nr:hypothetical protein [Deltaproteobacteria bacterium]HCP46758.1 hypothetical protein [Deltaproteobacteria bacterium]